MAKSPKSSDYYIVPWYNSQEWQNVYKLIIDKEATRNDWQRALDVITTWQIRTPLLPSGVEGTLCILEALLVDEDAVNERQYQILCASSVMRFLNICVASRATINNFTKTAKDHSIPDWIIRIRHDFAHSQQLPGVALLRFALKEAFAWLQNTYWLPEQSIINDYVITDLITAPQSIETPQLFSLFMYLFVYDVHEHKHDEFIEKLLHAANFKSETEFYPQVLLQMMTNHSENLTFLQWRRCFAEMMKTRWFSIAPSSVYSKKAFLDFSHLLSIIEKQQKLAMFVEELFYIVHDENELASKEASMWINEIFKGVLNIRFAKHVRLNGIPGFGIIFNAIDKSTVNDLLALKCNVISTPEIFRTLFLQSFLLIADIDIDLKSAVKEMNKKTEFLSREETVEDSWELLEAEDKYKCLLDSLLRRENTQSSSPNHRVCSSNHENTGRRWNIVKDTTAFAQTAIGVLPLHLGFE